MLGKGGRAVIKFTLTPFILGRPVNFQGIGGEKSNQQAEQILRVAAKRAGFTQVEFLFEPLAAGMDFESRLEQDSTVLVVDVGGGTTDCSMVKMGPSHIDKRERGEDFLGHSGQRVGGNDLDIALSMTAYMPALGLGSQMKNDIPVPRQPYWNAVAVNDISAQRDFSSLNSRMLLKELIKDAAEPKKVARLLKVQQEQLGYGLVRSAEQAKIALSDESNVKTNLCYIEQGLEADVTADTFSNAISQPYGKIERLISAVISTAGLVPDLIYVTGGTAKSPVILNNIKQLYPDIDVVVGDHFGSVTAGLTRWAQRVFSM